MQLIRPCFLATIRSAIGKRNYCNKIPRPNHLTDKFQPNTKKISLTWKSVSLTVATGGLFIAFLSYIRQKKREEIDRERKRVVGKAKIGGGFELVDCDGKTRSSKDFRGQWLLIYFGFTHCPDVCPDELEKLAKVVDNLAAVKSEPIQPIFITVDPFRDTPEAIKKYCAEFTPKLLGLTGTIDQIAQACKAYRVYFSAGPKDHDDDYIVDHTIIMYLVDPMGNFVDYFGQNRNAAQVTASIQFHMEKFKRDSKPTGLLSLEIFKNNI